MKKFKKLKINKKFYRKLGFWIGLSLGEFYNQVSHFRKMTK